MRVKDEFKQEALFRATVDLVNETGFVASSVSKIAGKAKVSPATIYVYYKNKEDLLVSTYLAIKMKMSEAMLEDFDESLPIRDIFFRLWQNLFRFVEVYPGYFQFTEQFSNSPYSDLINKAEVEKFFEPIMQVMESGIRQKIIKDVHFDILTAFMLFPVYSLSNKRLCANFIHNKKNIETAFSLAWDAIKL
jgi:AcrR family transcriptional regulator